jgi:FkbM family methyltransferase
MQPEFGGLIAFSALPKEIDAAMLRRRYKFAIPSGEIAELTALEDAPKKRLACFVDEIRRSKHEIFIYGAGVGCKYVMDYWRENQFDFSSLTGIIDNHVKGERYGLPILCFADFSAKHKGALVLNSIGRPAGADVHKQCIDAGFNCLSLFELNNSWDQYFDLPGEMGTVRDGEVFVHAGCFNGNTQKSYISRFGETYVKMVTFEPNAGQFVLCKEQLAGLRDMEIVPAGLSDRAGTARFDPSGPGSSRISENGSEEIETVTLDAYMRGQRVTFIALDIEGGEFAALRGAEQIIRSQKPKLAISAYHKPEDMWELPLLMKEYNPEYRLYLRHYHMLDMHEIVLYAI